jgi:hypothetical protein
MVSVFCLMPFIPIILYIQIDNLKGLKLLCNANKWIHLRINLLVAILTLVTKMLMELSIDIPKLINRLNITNSNPFKRIDGRFDSNVMSISTRLESYFKKKSTTKQSNPNSSINKKEFDKVTRQKKASSSSLEPLLKIIKNTKTTTLIDSTTTSN